MLKTSAPELLPAASVAAPARWQDYILLLKPRVMSLVVFTALTGLVCAGAPMNPVIAAVAILCIAVGAGASGAFNMWYDADIDALMRRTRGRPVPAGRVQGADALALGVTLSLFSVALMGLALNLLAAALLAFTIFFYAVVYTMWLKRATPQNIVIGGLAGALPPAVGWAAASGTAPLNAWLMVAIIFFWTPPHFWALSLTTQDDYERAGVPMMPVVKGEAVLLAVLPLILGHTQGWPAWTWISLAASIFPLVAFVIIERRMSARDGRPLINLHVVTNPAVAWGLAAYGASLATYFSLLFILALYLQEGLGRSALYSGSALVSWVAAYGVGGPVVPHVPARFRRLVAAAGFLLLAATYFVISVWLFSGHAGGPVLLVLLGFGGLGLGFGVTGNIRQLTGSVPTHYAPDMSGLITTFQQMSGLIGVATFGTAYFSLVPQPGPVESRHGFAIVLLSLALTALFATFAAYWSSHDCPKRAAHQDR